MSQYKIGEISKRMGVSIRSLRYYDQIGLLNPSHKELNGYRYYNDEDIQILEKIIILQTIGIPLKEIKRIIINDEIEQELDIQEQVIENKIRHLALVSESIKNVKDKIKTNQRLSDIIDQFQSVFNGLNESFHTNYSVNGEDRHEKDTHDQVLKLLRKFTLDSYDNSPHYKKLLELFPQIKDDDFLSDFFVMLRLSNSKNFRLDEIDQIEKNIRKQKNT